MGEYDINKVYDFITHFNNEKDLVVRSNFLFVYLPQILGVGVELFVWSEMVKKFEELSPWEKCNAVYGITPLIVEYLVNASKELSVKAREADKENEK